MRTANAAFLLLLAACQGENDIVPQPPEETGVEVDTEADTELVVVEVPRVYFIEQPSAHAFSDAGKLLVSNILEGGDVYVWTEDEGLEWVTSTETIYNSVNDISRDGTVIVGEFGDYTNDEITQAAVWTEEDDWVKLGALPDTMDCPMQSAGWAIADDGLTVAGLAFSGCNGRAFIHTPQGGLVGMQHATENGGARASNISGDGSVVVGFSQGRSSRTPTWWSTADGAGHLLTMQDANGDPILDSDGNRIPNDRAGGEFHDVNYDGTLIVGQVGSRALAWTPERHRVLPTMGDPATSSARARVICGEGDEFIGGYSNLNGGTAFLYSQADDTIHVAEDYFAEFGAIFPADARLSELVACTPDLTHFAALGTTGSETGVWVVVFPDDTLPTAP